MSSEQATIPKSKLYTKTGDKGTTSLYNGTRVPKNSQFCQSVGDIDELSSCLGMLHESLIELFWKGGFESILPRDEQSILPKLPLVQQIGFDIDWIQSRLLDLGSHVATPIDSSSEHKIKRTEFDKEFVSVLEKMTDKYDAELPPLKNFILSKGYAHMARSICRRAERSMIPLLEEGHISEEAYIFINRLSDMLFALGRYITVKIKSEAEKIYKKA
jgi:cob(I)alamin adenosyltransferase